MRQLIVTLCCLLTLPVLGQRISIREENDVWTGSDSSYTQGAEIEYMGATDIWRDRPTRFGVSIRNLIYTPEDITIEEEQPDDRPWAGLSAVTLKMQRQHRHETVEHQLLIGTTGEWSYSDEIQTWFHELIGADKPMGWRNQIPEEVVVNYAFNGLHPFATYGKLDGWAADVAGTYGAAVGTAYVYGEGGALVRAGYNMPTHRLSIITPTSIFGWRPVGYVFGRAAGRYVAHNISIDGSWFQDGPSQDLEPIVTDLQAGVCVGAESFKYQDQRYNILLSYAATRRSDEFEGQNRATDFGTIHLAVGYDF
jgi:lipid A 3-O-deacylase